MQYRSLRRPRRPHSHWMDCDRQQVTVNAVDVRGSAWHDTGANTRRMGMDAVLSVVGHIRMMGAAGSTGMEAGRSKAHTPRRNGGIG